jgi:hypothetical protein
MRGGRAKSKRRVGFTAGRGGAGDFPLPSLLSLFWLFSGCGHGVGRGGIVPARGRTRADGTAAASGLGSPPRGRCTFLYAGTGMVARAGRGCGGVAQRTPRGAPARVPSFVSTRGKLAGGHRRRLDSTPIWERPMLRSRRLVSSAFLISSSTASPVLRGSPDRRLACIVERDMWSNLTDPDVAWWES